MIQVIDDSVYESAEQFELHLSEPSLPAVLGPVSTAVVIIEGPNDGKRTNDALRHAVMVGKHTMHFIYRLQNSPLIRSFQRKNACILFAEVSVSSSLVLAHSTAASHSSS